MANGEQTVRKDVMAVVQRGQGRNAKSFWTKIGVAFLMRDGVSWDLKLDFVPTDLSNTGIQLRDPRPRQEGAAEGEDAPAAE